MQEGLKKSKIFCTDSLTWKTPRILHSQGVKWKFFIVVLVIWLYYAFKIFLS